MKKADFVYIGRKLYEEGLVDSHSGGMSVREGDEIYITRRDISFSEITEEDIIKVPLSNESPADKEVSRELPTHRYIYANTGAKVVVNAYPPHAIGLSITENKIVPQDARAQDLIKGAPIIRVREAVGSVESGKYLVSNAYNNGYVVAMVKGYCSFAIGATLEEAYKYTSCLESCCKVLFVVKTVEGVQKSAGRPSSDLGPRDRTSRMPSPGSRMHVGRDERRSAIPPGIGVMDRSRRGRQ
ncbi:MAG: class II aldolase/adducin family protein [Candidatus Margulisiibacteriota bacterium]